MMMLISRLACLLLVLKLSLIKAEEEPLVKINDGLIKGSFDTSTNGQTYVAFEGIPFAEPPTGKRRFKEPQPPKPWSGVLHANVKYACIQHGIMTDKTVKGQEDCLYLNVYVPRRKINPQERLPVIFYIHGGAFMIGSATSMGGPKHLMDRDVVFVSTNYRLGPLGFLSAEDADVTGNFGLKDQSFALKWVKDNIAAFGGDPDSVTITGLSAGGGSVHFHYFSEMSKGLFHKGFAQSGTALNPWALQKHPYENFKKLSTIVGCYNESVRIALECLRQRPALQITEAVEEFIGDNMLPLAPFAPVIEFISHSTFVHIPPFFQLGTKIANDLPLLISMTTEEGILPAGLFYTQRDLLNKEWETLLPQLLDYDHISDDEKHRINKVLTENYFKNEPVTEENFKNLVKMCTHRNFLVGSVKAAKMQSKVSLSPIHYLLMGYGGDATLLFNRIYTQSDVNLGVPHGADSIFYYNTEMWPRKLSEDETAMKDQLVDMLVNFAKTGNVSLGGVDWKPVSDTENLDYVLVKGPRDIVPKSSKKIAPINFWNSLGLKEDENVYTFRETHVQIDA